MLAKTSSSKSITVSIVSHGQQELIVPLLEQLDRFCTGSIEKLVLTINIPESKQVDVTAYQFPIQLIVNARPRGFGANHNAAFAHCDTDWFLVLNPDIRVDHDILTPLLAQASPTEGLLAVRIVEPGKTTPEPYRALITPLEILRRQSRAYVPPHQPAWIPGMFMLFRQAAYAEIKGFDPRYFLYGEDFDVCARVRLAGWQLHVRTDLTTWHQAQRASHRQFRHLRWHLVSIAKIWLSATFWRYRALLQQKRHD